MRQGDSLSAQNISRTNVPTQSCDCGCGWMGHSSGSVSGVAGDGYLSHKLLFKYCSLVSVCPLEKSTKRMINDAPRTNILISNILRSDPRNVFN